MMKFTHLFPLCLLFLGCVVAAQGTLLPISPKVFVITMFDISGIGGETLRWIQRENLTQQISVPMLSPNFPYVHCKPPPLTSPYTSDMCVVTTDQTFANAGASIVAVLGSGQFDFKNTYFIVAGIAGVDPADGTLGSAAWARFVINYGIAYEIDARQMPEGWPYGYTGFGPVPPGVYPTRWVGVEVFQLNETLLQRAMQVTGNLDLTVNDNPTAQAYRANYPNAPANQPPTVIQCDSTAIDTYWHGSNLSVRANDWTSLLTNGTGNYCMTNEEDSATMNALKRGADAGLLDFNRVAVLRTASNFDQPYPGQTVWDSLNTSSGGFFPSCENAYFVGSTLAHDIINNWQQYQQGIIPQ
jgi:purine nucleoside permease